MNEIKIDGKEYKYFLRREHVYLFTRILGTLDLDVKEVKTINDIVLVIKMIQNSLLEFKTPVEESLNFISAIYNLEPEEVSENGLIFEMKLWENLFKDEYLVSFFSRVIKSFWGKKKEEAMKKISQKKKT